MPATIKTREIFDKDTTREALEKEIQLRLLAGAIRSQIINQGASWLLETEWNVFGQQ